MAGLLLAAASHPAHAASQRATAPAASAATEIPLGGSARLVLAHPADWSHDVAGPAAFPTLRLHGPGTSEAFRLLITSMPQTNTALADDAALERMVRQAGEALLPTAEQTRLELVPVRGASATGLLYHLTDRAPERGPGDFRELRQGVVRVGGVLLSVTLLTHEGDAEQVAEGLAALASAAVRKD